MKFFLLVLTAAAVATDINAFATLPPPTRRSSSPSLSSLNLLDEIAVGLFAAASDEADVDEFKEAYAENHRKAFLLDIREPNDWKEAHLSHATPAPYSQLMSGKWMDNKSGKFYQGTLPLDRFTGVSIEQNAKIFVHCKGNNERVKEAVKLLEQMGYTQVVALKETFDELAAANLFDVVSGEVQSLADPSG